MKRKDTYRIECIDNNEKQRLQQVAVECVSKIEKAIQDLRQNVTMGYSNPPQAVYYIKDILEIPLRQNQIEAGVAETSGKTEESYYLSFIPTSINTIIIDLKITDHFRQENHSDAIDNKEHPNVRASTVVTSDTEGVPTTKFLPIYKANGIRIRRIEQQIPIAFMGAPNLIINNLEVLKQLFIKGSFGKYKKKRNNNGGSTPSSSNQSSLQEIKQRIHMKRKQLNEYHVSELVLHYIETDYDGRHYYYDDNKGLYVGKGGTPDNPQYLYTACGRFWEPDSEVECDNIRVLKESKHNKIKITESELRNMIGKIIKEAYDMNRVSRWGKRNGYELNGNVLSNGDEDITFNNDGEYDSSSQGFPSSDFEKYMNGTPASSDELRQYVSSKIGSDYRFTQAIAEYNEEAMSDIANDMSQEIDCTSEEALDAIHKVANEYAYYNPSEEDLQESAKKGKTRITETHLRNIISESIKKVLNEGMKGIDPSNAVPQDVAEKYGFKPEYGGDEFQLWGRRIDPKNARVLLSKLGIRNFTTYNVDGKVRITVKVNDGGWKTANRIKNELRQDSKNNNPAFMKCKYGLTPQEAELLTLDYLTNKQQFQVQDIIKKAVKYRLQTTNYNVNNNWKRRNLSKPKNITEAQLKDIVAESVKNALNEFNFGKNADLYRQYNNDINAYGMYNGDPSPGLNKRLKDRAEMIAQQYGFDDNSIAQNAFEYISNNGEAFLNSKNINTNDYGRRDVNITKEFFESWQDENYPTVPPLKLVNGWNMAAKKYGNRNFVIPPSMRTVNPTTGRCGIC